MSTRSVVYARTESGTKGVYVHSDGYPEWALPALHGLIAKHGLDRTVTTLLGKPNGWSHLDPDKEDELPELYRDGRFEAVPGFGVQYTEVDNQGDTEYRTLENPGWDIEFLYVIEPDGTITWTTPGLALVGEWSASTAEAVQ